MASSASPAPFTTEILPVVLSDIDFPREADVPCIQQSSVTFANLHKAADIITKHIAPVAFPTETVYGLGASALSSTAVRQIFAAKNRPSDNPLIVHISSVSQLQRVLHTKVPEVYEPLVQKFWPGPLTIILPLPDPIRNKDGTETPAVSPACTPGQTTFGVRMPSHPVARALIAITDTPIAAPSANASSRPSPTTAMHVFTDMAGRIPLILDGGPCNVGLESTVIDGTVSPPAVLRPGGVSIEDIRKYGGPLWKDVVTGKSEAGRDEKVRTPGMKYRHYSPKAKVVVFVGQGDGSGGQVAKYLRDLTGDLKIGVLPSRSFNLTSWDDEMKKKVSIVKELGKSGAEISRNLFAHLRDLDDAGVDLIIAEGVGEEDEGAAIMNRLRKAATELLDNGQHIVKK
ncbi:DHBP synthase RibB-like alpha/beta domain-containing protein [Lipomyces tetrasporus]|uniref:Threonylcarbamoyl-AMP synthase n=1 Tax=Lipomyces tetrasporus TaxID=54092 RepID=A0AAD7VQW2_9ASCO|nr:DHBP synthase RibB-like alpha/beta domain-containing protein [Lipomyces tetrasporus]KAJ8097989.1 DHBP synthase RibB-like alpha/beta domain-containing protein [Lipomyces tetrasporus]